MNWSNPACYPNQGLAEAVIHMKGNSMLAQSRAEWSLAGLHGQWHWQRKNQVTAASRISLESGRCLGTLSSAEEVPSLLYKADGLLNARTSACSHLLCALHGEKSGDAASCHPQQGHD